MSAFYICVAMLALLMSKIALFYFIIFTYRREYDAKLKTSGYLNREKLKIKLPPRDKESIIAEAEKIKSRKKTLILTLLIGEIVGFIFLGLSSHDFKFIMLEIDGFCLLVGSLICQVLNMFNAWTKTKMNLLIRLSFQIGLMISGLLLIKFALMYQMLVVDPFLLYYVTAYFSTVAISIFSMLLDALLAKQGIYQFDFNHYHRLVIVAGLIIGSAIYLKFSLSVL